VLKPVENVEVCSTQPFEKLGDSYDVIVAGGARAGRRRRSRRRGWAPACSCWKRPTGSAARCRAAGVTALVYEGGSYGLRIVRERRASTASSTRPWRRTTTRLNKDPFRGDRSYGDSNTNAGYEPKVARAGLYR